MVPVLACDTALLASLALSQSGSATRDSTARTWLTRPCPWAWACAWDCPWPCPGLSVFLMGLLSRAMPALRVARGDDAPKGAPGDAGDRNEDMDDDNETFCIQAAAIPVFSAVCCALVLPLVDVCSVR